ncbi:MAG: FAD:protein FMN transferase, partial [Pseudomonadota bacterium]
EDVMFRLRVMSLMLLVVACDEDPTTLSLTGETMGTTYNIVAVDRTGSSNLEEVSDAVEETLTRVNAGMSNWDPNSEISRFNAVKHTEPVPVSAELADVMQASIDIHARSGGLFDVTLGPLIELWGFGVRRSEDPIPTDREIAEALDRVGQSKFVALTRIPDTLRKSRPDTSIYLAAIAKGHGVDEIALTLRALGFEDFMVEIGGDLFATGLSTDDKPWRIGIERPDAQDRVVEEIIELSGYGLATSGDYRNYFEENGIRYPHILDARTGRPMTHKTASATVIADTAMLADGWATAMLALGSERGMQIAEEQGLAVFFITRVGGSDVTQFEAVASTRFQALQAGE